MPRAEDGQLDRERTRLLRELERSIGYRFGDKQLLNRALSHRSYAHQEGGGRLDSYERLEFLGDAVLGLALSASLFRRFPEAPEGDLTERKSYFASRPVLARVAEEIGLQPYLQLSNRNQLLSGRSATTILADCLEGLIGALYLDRGWKVAEVFVRDRILDSKAVDYQNEGLFHAKSKLLEETQRRYQRQPEYVILEEQGPEHRKTFSCEVKLGNRVLGRGSGKSKKEAEKQAALAGLRSLRQRGSRRRKRRRGPRRVG